LVEQYAQNGELSEFAFLVLKPKRKTLGITDTKAEEIETEVLEPFRKRLANLQSYKQAFAKAVEQKYPLDEHILNILKDYQQDVLGLRDEDVVSIKLEITSVKEAEYQKQLQIQKQREAEALQLQQQAKALSQLRLQQEAERLQRQREAEAAEQLRVRQEAKRMQQEVKRLQRQREVEAAEQLRLQLKTFQFETAQINKNGTEIKRIIKSAEYFTQDLGNGVLLEMVHIPGGTFLMGSPESEEGRYSDESPQHQVTVPSFFMGKYPVTQKQWQAVAALEKVKIDLESDPSNFKGDNLPVGCVSWDSVQEFCARLSQRTNQAYRLPSEAEWEYACRAGTTTPFYFGETISTDLANYNGNYTYGQGQKGEYREKTTEVGIFPANPFGLYDMCGNVWEWCEDKWHENYISAPIDGSAWTSLSDNDKRLLRGGSWSNDARGCRSAFRNRSSRGGRSNYCGFRVVSSFRTL
jgi:formylglycine-generating enzyme required for sulfatase activity